MDRLLGRYMWKWMWLIGVSLLMVAFMPETELPNGLRIVLGFWVLALCIVLPVSGDFWSKQIDRILNTLFNWEIKRFGKHRMFTPFLFIIGVTFSMWMLIQLALISIFTQFLFFLMLVTGLFVPAVYIFTQSLHRGDHA